MNSLTDHLLPLEDLETLQSKLLSSAISGNATVRSALPELVASMDEPYRTTAGVVVSMLKEGKHVDKLTVQVALAGKRLTRSNKDSVKEDLDLQQVMNLIFASDASNMGVEQYVEILRQQVIAKRREATKMKAIELAEQYGGDLSKLQDEIECLPRYDNSMATDYPSEVELFLPFIAKQALLDGNSKLTGLDTGFPLLNDVTNGLDTGVYILSAKPSLGKTTFAMQLCQQVAEINKCPVIIVSLEQSAKELRLKAISRLAPMNCSELHRNNLGLGDPARSELLGNAVERYLKLSQYLTIVEGDNTTTVDVIRDISLAKMAELNSNRCLIAIDYLQLLRLPPEDSKVEIRERVDRNLSNLRRVARELDSPVLAISSLNREGYNNPSLESLKESGGIEYGADVVIVMCSSDSNGNMPPESRQVDMKIMKNRNGSQGILNYEFKPHYSQFIETGKAS